MNEDESQIDAQINTLYRTRTMFFINRLSPVQYSDVLKQFKFVQDAIDEKWKCLTI